MWNKDNWDASNSWSGGSLTCQSLPEERPAMKDVTAMLKEIRHENDEFEKPDFLHKGMVTNTKAAVHCSSLSRSCQPLIDSPSSINPYKKVMVQGLGTPGIVGYWCSSL
ncbi:hypothetical protein HN51_010780 [Arachis hypogaea]